MHRFKVGLFALVSVATAFCAQAAKADVIYSYSFDGSAMAVVPAFTANVNLNVAGGHAISGTGSVNFGGGNFFDLTLITPATPGNIPPVGFGDNNGTHLLNLGTAVPIDGNGLLFAITNSPLFGHDPLFAVWFNGGNNYGFAFSGALPTCSTSGWILAKVRAAFPPPSPSPSGTRHGR